MGLAHQPQEKEDLVIFVRFPRSERSSLAALKDIKLMSLSGQMIPVSELVRVERHQAPKSIYHKNLLPAVYVTADVSGREDSPVYAILKLNKRLKEELKLPDDRQTNIEVWNIRQPSTTDKWAIKWDGEWHRFRCSYTSLSLVGSGISGRLWSSCRQFLSPRWNLARPCGGGRFLHRNQHDRFHRWSGDRGPKLHHLGGLH